VEAALQPGSSLSDGPPDRDDADGLLVFEDLKVHVSFVFSSSSRLSLGRLAVGQGVPGSEIVSRNRIAS
jgi:hypothetical protein